MNKFVVHCKKEPYDIYIGGVMQYRLKIIDNETEKVIKEYPPMEDFTLEEIENQLYKQLDHEIHSIEVEEVEEKNGYTK